MTRLIFLLIFFLTLNFSLCHAMAPQIEFPRNIKSEEIIRKTTPKIIEQFIKKKLTYGSPIFIRIFKESFKLELWVKNRAKFKLFKTYYICDLSGTLGPKTREGDRQAPEGFYSVAPDQLNPWSKHHLSFNLGYPNDYDLAYHRTGSGLMIHGKCNSIGCFAMSDFRIDEIYTLADIALLHGQNSFPVHIFPFKMTEKNLKNHQGKWSPFWRNLKEGYDLFQKTSVPPYVGVKNCRYIFSQKPYQTTAITTPDVQACREN